MHLLKEDDRNRRGAGGGNESLGAADTPERAGHVLDPDNTGGLVGTSLDVDDDERRSSDE
jgi:hypothetical protein